MKSGICRHSRTTPRQRLARQGLSLAEVAVSTLLVGVLMVASLRSVESSLRTWQAASASGDGTALAQQLLDEIMLVTYAEDVGSGANFGPESGETTSPASRTLFDDLDDYDDWTASPPQDATGNPLPNYTGWTRSVIVKKLSTDLYEATSDNSADHALRQITVTVTSPTGEVTTLIGWRSSAGGTQQALGVDQTIVTWVGCTLQLDPSDAAISSGTLVTNHAEDN